MAKNKTSEVVSPDENTNPNPLATAPSYQSAPDMTPTAAEYERDAILARELAEKKVEERKAAEKAAEDGKLPPGAQTLEEAREALRKAEEMAKDKQAAAQQSVDNNQGK